ncbi:MAG: hypothetical protein Q8N99_00660 [Nanoarchaeota archaeon]|nr:hypothetical protein [Nanoarchaeota archaeon]
MKRGKTKLAQISVFIILGIVLVCAVGIAYYISLKGDSSKEFFTGTKNTDIKNSILECTDSATKDALEKVSLQGGYYAKPENAFNIGITFIPYYYYEGKYLMPEKTKVENELSSYVNDKIGNCIDNNKQGYDVSYNKANTKTTINKGEVMFLIDMPITIKDEKETIKIELKQAPVLQKSKLYEIMEVARYITDSHKQYPDMLCITCVADLAEERNLYVNSFDMEDNKVLFIISENETTRDFFSFEFMNKYGDIGGYQEDASLPEMPEESK